jgi:hypothetical protein
MGAIEDRPLDADAVQSSLDDVILLCMNRPA